MFRPRVIPCLLLKEAGLVKTVKFKDAKYIGDPINAVKIFNDKGADELIFLDITATLEKREPNLKMISEIASEAFMPVGYGGGINSIEQIKEILSIGIEKVIINTHAFGNPSFISEASAIVGSQSIVVSIDVRKNFWGRYEVVTRSGQDKTGLNPVELAIQMEKAGAGEIFINSVDRDGTMEGYDVELIKKISQAVNIPVVACGGAGRLQNFKEAVQEGGASAVAAGSFFVFHGKYRAVLITYPHDDELNNIFRQ